ncbi:hypothetical protein DQ353_20915 [Arthrobacter sp. AQ5-05]|uniref:MFS transporter n=1 Tax=Arthrobacter sp. AQ5-05 TaxID=2184581 RepID=UPI000DCD866D|nr:MFS transporter [Arthrobacter sp. AQ5-05]RAX45928.1 hypothetical protein DQ353_20915 [Arthrobacter sp. AQ5-05]
MTSKGRGETKDEDRVGLDPDHSPPKAGRTGHRPGPRNHRGILHAGRGDPYDGRDLPRIDAGPALWAGVIGNLAFMVSLPFWGKLSDKIGRKPLLMLGLGGSALMQLPMSWLFRGEVWQLVVSMSVLLVLMGAMLSIMPATYAELFPTGICTMGVAVPYSVCVARFGGTAPYLNAWPTGSFGGWTFAIYATLLFAVSVACIFGIRESRGKVLSSAVLA